MTYAAMCAIPTSKSSARAELEALIAEYKGTTTKGKTRRAHGSIIPRSTVQDAPGISIYDLMPASVQRMQAIEAGY